MAGINKVIIVGNLGSEPELRETQTGKSVCTFRVATSTSYTKGDGERVEQTEWHSIVVFGRQAETAAQYLAKGRQVGVEGRLQTREYEDKEGVKRRVTEIVAENVQFLGGSRGGDDAQGGSERRPSGRSSGGRGGGGGRKSEPEPEHSSYEVGQEDDIPF